MAGNQRSVWVCAQFPVQFARTKLKHFFTDEKMVTILQPHSIGDPKENAIRTVFITDK